MHSGNTFAMYSLFGQTSYNLFEHDLTNHVPQFNVNTAPLSARLLLDRFRTASAWPTMMGLSDMATYDQFGNKESIVNFPFRLVFHPV